MSLNIQTAIDTLLEHHIKENHLPTGYAVARKEIILLILGLGGLNYVPVAYYNGKTVTISIINAITTAILGELILYSSGKIYYDIKIAPQYITEELKNIIQAPLTERAFIREVLAQLFFAAASAVPLATTLFEADLQIFKDNPWLFWLALAYIEIVNTAMHLVPIELTMRDPFYNFPIRFLSWLSGFLPITFPKICPLEIDETDSNAALAQRAKIWRRLHPLLVNAKQNFLHKLSIQKTDDIQSQLSFYQSNPQKLLKDLLACYVATPTLNAKTRIIARTTGGLLVAGACLGYAANPYLVFKNDFHFSMTSAISITILPIYFFMVLMAFFGDSNGQRALQDMSALFFQTATLQKHLPTLAKFYPLTFILTIAVILFVIAFAGAPGREMMMNAFENVFPTWLMIMMMGVVDLGIGTLLSSYVLLDFTKVMLNHYAQHYGAEPQKGIAIMKAKIEALIRDFKRLHPEFAQDLENHILSLMPDNSIELNQQSANPNPVSYRSWCNFLTPNPHDLDQESLRTGLLAKSIGQL